MAGSGTPALTEVELEQSSRKGPELCANARMTTDTNLEGFHARSQPPTHLSYQRPFSTCGVRLRARGSLWRQPWRPTRMG
jgi:hypothetical protein